MTPNRSDWAYEAAAAIYALTMQQDRRPIHVMDDIAEHLRLLNSEGNCMRMLARIQKDWGCGND